MDNEHQPSDTDSHHITSLYHIDNKVEFDHQKCLLRSLETDTTFTLLAAASECFLVLLMNHGHLVNKSKLIHEGWEKYGLHVSDNTFYQNILVLRKGLRTCGIDYEVIRTLPRKGLIVPETIQVTEIPLNIPESKISSVMEEELVYASEANEDIQCEENAAQPNLCAQSYDDAQRPQTPVFVNDSTTAVDAQNNNQHDNEPYDKQPHFVEDGKKNEAHQYQTPEGPFAIKESLTPRNMIILLLLILAAGTLLYFTRDINSAGEDYFTHYKRQGVEQGCNIYISESITSAFNVKNFLSDNGIKCNNNETLYISTHDFIARKSLLKCSRPFGSGSKDNSCMSYYIMDGDYDQ
ncbi:hypothetical protein [uncultured Pluralibacter sp.]|uniref:winged helix-turn-helix domain-containing protein n=1 Tax=uncultured Pluralibacter sp. TaxID=1490864 RepID=UPI0026345034|nr:hypothetical protein [uncultured Pluralibacter sp.]